MIPHCGRIHRVERRIQSLIDDRNGRMLTIGGDCIVLEGLVCSAKRLFCPREFMPCWLERVAQLEAVAVRPQSRDRPAVQ